MMKREIKKKDKIVLVSGAAGGLGRALVKIFLDHGYRVIAADVERGLQADAEGIPGFLFKTLDVTDPKRIDALRTELELDRTGLDILINAAGIYDAYPVTEADPGLFRKMMAVNLHGAANMIQGMLVPLVKSKGRVIVISSESYKIQAMFQPYMISKASLEAYCRVARQELALKGVQLTVIRPGAIGTPLLKWMNAPVESDKFPVFQEELNKSWEQSVKRVGKMAKPETVARLVFKAATTSGPKRVFRINNSPTLKLISLLPNSIFDGLLVRFFRVKK